MEALQLYDQHTATAVPVQSAAQVERLTANAWTIAYTALWNGKKFEPAEISAVLQFIRSFIQAPGLPAQNYEQFAERILAAREQDDPSLTGKRRGPLHWFTAEGSGFAATKTSYRLLTESRSGKKWYCSDGIDLAWAIWYVIPGASLRFHHWRSYFNCGNGHMLNLYLACLANAARSYRPPVKHTFPLYRGAQ